MPATVHVKPTPFREEQNTDKVDPTLVFLSRLMDNIFEVPGLGVRFGLDPIIGLIPGVGDAISSVISLYILSAAARYQLPRITVLRMAMNIAIDSVCGALPIIGDVFDVYWKANVKNVEILRRSIASTPPVARQGRIGDWLFVGGLIGGVALIIIGTWVVVFMLAMYLYSHLSWK